MTGAVKSAGTRIYDYSKVTQKPEFFNKSLGAHPDDARKEGLTGKVIVTLILDENGDVSLF